MNEEIPLEIGQVWETQDGKIEIVALGPEYVAFKYLTGPGIGLATCSKNWFRKLGLELVPPPKPKHTVWLNVYSCSPPRIGYHETKAQADIMAYGRLACIKVEFQEGDGLA